MSTYYLFEITRLQSQCLFLAYFAESKLVMYLLTKLNIIGKERL